MVAREPLELLSRLGAGPQRRQMAMICPQERRQDARVERITLCAAYPEAIPRPVEGLGVHWEHEDAMVQQKVDDAALRFLDRGPELDALGPPFVEPPPPLAQPLRRVRHDPPHDLSGVLVLHRSEEHTSELQSLAYLVCRLLLEKKKKPTPPMQS